MDKHIDETSITIINGVYEFLVRKKSSRTEKNIKNRLAGTNHYNRN